MTPAKILWKFGIFDNPDYTVPQFSLEYFLFKVNRQNPKITSSLKRFKTV